MHTRDGDQHIFECDECGEEFNGELGDDFHEAWATAKREGWRCWKDDDGDWTHRCPGCR